MSQACLQCEAQLRPESAYCLWCGTAIQPPSAILVWFDKTLNNYITPGLTAALIISYLIFLLINYWPV